jgi:hypothetical protein
LLERRIVVRDGSVVISAKKIPGNVAVRTNGGKVLLGGVDVGVGYMGMSGSAVQMLFSCFEGTFA